MENNTEEKDSEINSLEDPGTVIESDNKSSSSSDATSGGDKQPVVKKKTKFADKLRGIIGRVNIYFLIFLLLVVISGGIVFVGFQRGQRELSRPTVITTPLTPETLEELRDSEAKVGDSKQTLSIESNTIFSGRVLMRSDLDVAGTIRVGGALSLPGITVSGTSTFDQIQANRLSITGDTNIQGQMTVQQSLTVTGGASFGGAVSMPVLNVESLQLSGDLQINRHIDAGGPTPSRSNGSALGSGGTSSVSGTDTAGTLTLNIGGSPAAGCFITVNFANRFNATPHVVVTPVGSAGAGLRYYVNRTSSNFSLCSTTPASAGTSFSFDYIAID